MPHFVTPNSYGTVREFNPCHSPEDGKFCSTTAGPLSSFTYPEGSVKIPAYLKDDVARARRAGIVTYHHQQPEPVRDAVGKIHDPLAMSNARRGPEDYRDKKWGSQTAQTGRVYITTRGGVFVPEYQTWGHYGPTGYKKKELTPEMLTNPASIHDIVSTYRHEVGHIMDANFGSHYNSPSKTMTVTLAREIRAWTYAVEIAPDHTVSDTMVRFGLESHAYHEFRRLEHLNSTYGQRVARYDREEWSDRMVKNESSIDAPTMERASRLATRVIASLTKYGAVLRKKGIVRVPQAKPPWFAQRTIHPGPGRGGIL